MTDPREAGHPNGLPNNRQQASQQPRRQDAFSRPFTLYEALPYTPFTSIVPFNPDIIPTPNLGSAIPAPSLTDLVPSGDFDSLNAEDGGQLSASRRLEQAVGQFQNLLDPKRVTSFKFKCTPSSTTSGEAPPDAPSMAANLSPFSKAIYDQTSVAYRYPTPETPVHTVPNGQLESPTPAEAKIPVVQQTERPRHHHAASNKQAHAQNSARIEIVLPTKREIEEVAVSANGAWTSPAARRGQPTPVTHLPPSTNATLPAQDTSRKPKPMSHAEPVNQHRRVPVAGTVLVELPRPETLNKTEYAVLPDELDAPRHLSSRKSDSDGYDVLGDSLDVRQRSDAAFQDLRRFIRATHEAEGQLQALRTNELVYLTAQDEPTLTVSAQRRIHTILDRAISLNCFRRVPLDDLLRVSRLSDTALRHAEALDVKFDGAWGEPEVEQWLQVLPDIDVALRAARTMLRMMSGGREDRQLYSEETIERSLNLLRNVMDGIIAPLADLRSSGPSAALFKLLASRKARIGSVLTACQRLLALMGALISAIDTSESVMNTLEFASSRLVFLENAHTEKDSVVETQKFDGLRLAAMDILSQVFLLNPAQRQGIFDDILTSLEKLPVGKQRARQFKLHDGTSIQPVSALIMRLVQVSSGKVGEPNGQRRPAGRLVPGGDEDGDDDEDDGDGPAGRAGSDNRDAVFAVNSEHDGATDHVTAVSELDQVVKPLVDTAARNASYVINFIVKRALKSTKTGDAPYRNLLDLFVEDFTSCLNNPEWPAAELLLRLLMFMMHNLVEGERTAAPAKNMALEILGVINASISRVRSYVRRMTQALDSTEKDELGTFLSELGVAALEQKSQPEHMLAWLGPYRATLEYLERRHSEDPHLSSAITYFVSEWAAKIHPWYHAFDDDEKERDGEFGRLAYRLRMMINDRRWLSSGYTFQSVVSANHARLSYAITLLRSQLCESFGAILNILLSSMASDQATVRSRSLKSINQVLETDPSILDGDSVVIQLILQCSNDSSTQVRDSALGLIGKCITMRPALEDRMVETVIQRFIDAGPGVRKRAIKLARDIYLRNHSSAVRSAIANGLLHRVQDPEEGVRDLARQMIEETWFAPFYGGESSVASKMSLADHVALIVQTVKQGNVGNVLDKVLQAILGPESKTAAANLEVCTKLVASLFDLVDNPDAEDASAPSGKDALQVLMTLAKADARLLTFEQIRLLKPYIATVSTSDDLAVSRAVVVIYRLVLPQLTSVHREFLEDVLKKLMPAVSKVTRVLLDDVIACLWIISGLLGKLIPLTRLLSSSLVAMQKIRSMNKTSPMDERTVRQFERYSLIVGMVGKHCNLDSHHEDFQTQFPKWTGTSVSKLMVDVVVPFAAASQPLDVRKAALDAVGLVCQSAPRNYVAANVYTTFQQVFDEQVPVLENMILRSLKEFLLIEEKRSEQASADPAANGRETAGKRELTVMGGTTYDDVASATTHRFLREVTRIALATQDEHAFLAVEVLASINRQGLVHPKETGVTLITLETSPVPRISELAFVEHKALHDKHETVLEREYVKAIQSAFVYQRDIVKDAHGATTNPFAPKLHLMMEVLKVSKSKNRQRFLEKLCAQVDFDPNRLDASEEPPAHVQFSRFIIENLAFFEYMTVGELQATVAVMEKLVSSTGATVAHATESEVFQVSMDAEPSQEATAQEAAAPEGQAPRPAPLAELGRLRQLTAASMVLLSLWEARTYLRRLYGMGTSRRDPRAKGQAKDLARSPVKVQGINGERFWDEVGAVMTALSCRERMMETCRALVELMNVDKELRIEEDDEDDEAGDDVDEAEPATPSGGEDGDEAAGRGRKRKASAGTPGGRKKRARSSSAPRKRGRPKKATLPVIDTCDADGEFEEDDWV